MALYRFVTVLFLSALGIGWSFAQTAAKPAPAKPTQAQPAKATAPAPADKAPVAKEQIPPALPNSIYPALVARVNGKPIYGRDLDRLVKAELQSIGNPAWSSLREEYRAELTGKHLSSLVANELIFQKATASGTTVTAAEVQAELEKLSRNFPNDAVMNTELAKQGLDRAELVKGIERTLILDHYVRQNVTNKITITPEEVSQYYSGHMEQFKHDDLVRTSHILIMVKNKATAAEIKTAQDKAEAILARLKKGEDFAKLAKENSADGSAAQGGDIGWIKKGMTAPEYDAAAFSLGVGQISAVVTTRFGFHIIKVTGQKQAGVYSLDEIRTDLTDMLKQQKSQEQVQNLLRELRAQAKIETLLAVYPANKK
jgi:peptidyl-prolyl cis-trans isomerase C